MADNADVTDDTSNVTDDDTDLSQDDSVVDTDDLEAVKAENARIKIQNTKLFERTKKAEGFEKKPDGSWVKVVKKPEIKPDAKPVTSTESYDLEDVAVLVQKVPHKEDREMVKDYAKFKKISLEEALNNPIIQSELKDKAEKRQTSNATNTGTARRGTTKPSPDAIMADAEKGKFPDDAEALAEARFESKKKK